MSKFTKYLKEALDAVAEPGYSDNASFGNTGGKNPVLTHTPHTSEKKEDIGVQALIDKNDISIDQDTVESIIALIDKTLNDWNREKNLDGNEIETVVAQAIQTGLIEVR